MRVVGEGSGFVLAGEKRLQKITEKLVSITGTKPSSEIKELPIVEKLLLEAKLLITPSYKESLKEFFSFILALCEADEDLTGILLVENALKCLIKKALDFLCEYEGFTLKDYEKKELSEFISFFFRVLKSQPPKSKKKYLKLPYKALTKRVFYSLLYEGVRKRRETPEYKSPYGVTYGFERGALTFYRNLRHLQFYLNEYDVDEEVKSETLYNYALSFRILIYMLSPEVGPRKPDFSEITSEEIEDAVLRYVRLLHPGASKESLPRYGYEHLIRIEESIYETEETAYYLEEKVKEIRGKRKRKKENRLIYREPLKAVDEVCYIDQVEVIKKGFSPLSSELLEREGKEKRYLNAFSLPQEKTFYSPEVLSLREIKLIFSFLKEKVSEGVWNHFFEDPFPILPFLEIIFTYGFHPELLLSLEVRETIKAKEKGKLYFSPTYSAFFYKADSRFGENVNGKLIVLPVKKSLGEELFRLFKRFKDSPFGERDSIPSEPEITNALNYIGLSYFLKEPASLTRFSLSFYPIFTNMFGLDPISAIIISQRPVSDYRILLFYITLDLFELGERHAMALQKFYRSLGKTFDFDEFLEGFLFLKGTSVGLSLPDEEELKREITKLKRRLLFKNSISSPSQYEKLYLLYAYVSFFLTTGARPLNIETLRKEDFDERLKRVVVLDKDTLKAHSRTLSLSQSVNFLLQNLKDTRLESRLFETSQGELFTPSFFQQTCKSFGLSFGNPYIFRHLYATILFRKGYSPRDISLLLGHEPLGLESRGYVSSVNLVSLQEEAEKVAEEISKEFGIEPIPYSYA